jgi:hypothetical protein
MYTKTRRSATAWVRESLIGRQRADLRAPDLPEFPISSSSPSAVQKVEPLRPLAAKSSGDKCFVPRDAEVNHREFKADLACFVTRDTKVLQHVVNDEARLEIAADHPWRED